MGATWLAVLKNTKTERRKYLSQHHPENTRALIFPAIIVTDFSGLMNLISVFIQLCLAYLKTSLHLTFASVVWCILVQHAKVRWLQYFQQYWLCAWPPHKVNPSKGRFSLGQTGQDLQQEIHLLKIHLSVVKCYEPPLLFWSSDFNRSKIEQSLGKHSAVYLCGIM